MTETPYVRNELCWRVLMSHKEDSVSDYLNQEAERLVVDTSDKSQQIS